MNIINIIYTHFVAHRTYGTVLVWFYRTLSKLALPQSVSQTGRVRRHMSASGFPFCYHCCNCNNVLQHRYVRITKRGLESMGWEESNKIKRLTPDSPRPCSAQVRRVEVLRRQQHHPQGGAAAGGGAAAAAVPALPPPPSRAWCSGSGCKQHYIGPYCK